MINEVLHQSNESFMSSLAKLSSSRHTTDTLNQTCNMEGLGEMHTVNLCINKIFIRYAHVMLMWLLSNCITVTKPINGCFNQGC
jgi:hypothetical protein